MGDLLELAFRTKVTKTAGMTLERDKYQEDSINLADDDDERAENADAAKDADEGSGLDGGTMVELAEAMLPIAFPERVTNETGSRLINVTAKA